MCGRVRGAVMDCRFSGGLPDGGVALLRASAGRANVFTTCYVSLASHARARVDGTVDT